MRRLWTADTHFGHANIQAYCRRPWVLESEIGENGRIKPECSADLALRSSLGLIKSLNEGIKQDDYVVHVGDFCFKGNERGVLGGRMTYKNYLAMLHGRWFLLRGNHDGNNKTKVFGEYLVSTVGGQRAFVGHYPATEGYYHESLLNWVYNTCGFVVCGHVHNEWAEAFTTFRGMEILNINVGVDVRGFRPITDDELFAIYKRATHEHKGDGKSVDVPVQHPLREADSG